MRNYVVTEQLVDEAMTLDEADDALDALGPRRDALLAVDDSLPVFHIRPVWIAHYSRPEQFDRREAAEADVREAGGSEPVAITKEWRWGIHGVNGEPILPESETLKNRVDALEQAHRLADPLGARVLDDEGNEV